MDSGSCDIMAVMMNAMTGTSRLARIWVEGQTKNSGNSRSLSGNRIWVWLTLVPGFFRTGSFRLVKLE